MFPVQNQRGIVELQFFQAISKVFKILIFDGINARKTMGLTSSKPLMVSAQGLATVVMVSPTLISFDSLMPVMI